LKKTKFLIFGGVSKFCFWADFAAMAVADSMPEVWLKSLEPHNF
jgi:hypothetical protein